MPQCKNAGAVPVPGKLETALGTALAPCRREQRSVHQSRRKMSSALLARTWYLGSSGEQLPAKSDPDRADFSRHHDEAAGRTDDVPAAGTSSTTN
jgi:hypothetical protein